MIQKAVGQWLADRGWKFTTSWFDGRGKWEIVSGGMTWCVKVEDRGVRIFYADDVGRLHHAAVIHYSDPDLLARIEQVLI